MRKRRDLRETHLIFSIDPEGCEDVDDTLSVRLASLLASLTPFFHSLSLSLSLSPSLTFSSLHLIPLFICPMFPPSLLSLPPLPPSSPYLPPSLLPSLDPSLSYPFLLPPSLILLLSLSLSPPPPLFSLPLSLTDT